MELKPSTCSQPISAYTSIVVHHAVSRKLGCNAAVCLALCYLLVLTDGEMRWVQFVSATNPSKLTPVVNTKGWKISDDCATVTGSIPDFPSDFGEPSARLLCSFPLNFFPHVLSSINAVQCRLPLCEMVSKGFTYPVTV